MKTMQICLPRTLGMMHMSAMVENWLKRKDEWTITSSGRVLEIVTKNHD